METRTLDQLHDSPLNNLKEITPESYIDLLENLKMGQHSTLLIMGDGEVIGGKHRLRAMRELGYTDAKFIILDFQKDEEMGKYFAILDGQKVLLPNTEVVPFYYDSIEEGKIQYALSHNSEGAHYKEDSLSILQRDFPGLHLDMFRLPTAEPQRITGSLKAFAIDAPSDLPSERPEKKPKQVTCPNCGHAFEV